MMKGKCFSGISTDLKIRNNPENPEIKDDLLSSSSDP
jgi:hypothetical protein